MDEFNDILEKTYDEVKKNIDQSEQMEKIYDRSVVYTTETDDEKNHTGEEKQIDEVGGIEMERTVEALDSIAGHELEECMTCVDKLTDKLKEIKVNFNIIAERNDQLRNEVDLQRQSVLSFEGENLLLSSQAEIMKVTKMESDEVINDLRKQIALLTSITYDGNESPRGKSRREMVFIFKCSLHSEIYCIAN